LDSITPVVFCLINNRKLYQFQQEFLLSNRLLLFLFVFQIAGAVQVFYMIWTFISFKNIKD